MKSSYIYGIAYGMTKYRKYPIHLPDVFKDGVGLGCFFEIIQPVIFELDGEEYGIDVLEVREIIRMPSITRRYSIGQGHRSLFAVESILGVDQHIAARHPECSRFCGILPISIHFSCNCETIC